MPGLSLQILPQEIAEIDPNDQTNIINSTIYPDPISGKIHDQSPDGTAHTGVTGSLALVSGPTVEAIINALNGIGARPRIWSPSSKHLSGQGALHAELTVL